MGLLCLLLLGLAYLSEQLWVRRALGTPIPPSRGWYQATATQRTMRRFVVAVSIDGLRSDVLTKLGVKQLPTFFRLRREGASTLNARTAFRYTNTLPNHTCMLTSRLVAGKAGHGYTYNRMPKKTIHKIRGTYVPSIVDHLHDRGFRTALFASKSKFILYPWSYGPRESRMDVIGPDHGRAKIDQYVVESRDKRTILALTQALHPAKTPPHFTFVHFRSPDSYGHYYKWMSSPYLRAVKREDKLLKKLLSLIEGHPQMKGHTTLLLTSDHGGVHHNHGQPHLLTNYRVPFFAWGKDVAKGVDLYALNTTHYRNPGRSRPGPEQRLQPIRNCHLANTAAALLGEVPIPGSTVGQMYPLELRRQRAPHPQSSSSQPSSRPASSRPVR